MDGLEKKLDKKIIKSNKEESTGPSVIKTGTIC
jgi:hypothetical protein